MNFLDICEQGDIIEVISNYNENCDLDLPFKLVCKLGYLEIAQWMYSQGVNIHDNHEYAMLAACLEDI
jgi:hypothetical protein